MVCVNMLMSIVPDVSLVSLSQIFFFGLYMALLTERLKKRQETGRESGGVTRSKGSLAGTQTRDFGSEDKASVHGMPAYLVS